MPLTKKILIIEDEAPMRRILKDVFEQEGLKVSEAADGVWGLEKALADHPDLILLDIVMPKMDGITLLKKLRADAWGQTVPVLILTNLSNASRVINAFEFDARVKNERLPGKTDEHIKSYLNKRLESGIDDYLIKTDCRLEDIVRKVKSKLK